MTLKNPWLNIVLLLVLLVGATACETTMPSDLVITPGSIWTSGELSTPLPVLMTPTQSYGLPAAHLPGEALLAPTADGDHYVPEGSHGQVEYSVRRGDMLSAIAEAYGVSMEAIVAENQIADPNTLEVGQILIIPAVDPQAMGPGDKIVPDSELVYGPLSDAEAIGALIEAQNGYLARYSQDVNGELLNGAEIVVRIAQSYSVNPRLLVSLVEYQGGWLTNLEPDEMENPFGWIDDWYVGLYRQLAWAAIHLNNGFYRWQAGNVTDWVLTDGAVVPISPGINAGTAGVQNFFAHLEGYEGWLTDVGPGGFYDTYYLLFGNPFLMAIEPLVPDRLIQPTMHLPFGVGETWAFTGGPHLSWDAGTPFGAIDFAPPGEALGCVETNAWVTAVADGVVTRTGNGVVILDLDLDGNEGSGWVVVYMHIESRERVAMGTFLRAGEAVGHPSCEGGLSSGTHVHMARKFNGVWVAAAGEVPFNLDGWVAVGGDEEYVGSLTRAGVVVESFEGNNPINQITR